MRTDEVDVVVQLDLNYVIVLARLEATHGRTFTAHAHLKSVFFTCSSTRNYHHHLLYSLKPRSHYDALHPADNLQSVQCEA